MERNFFRRVEVAFPILHPGHQERILRDLDIYLQDNTDAWLLDAQGAYTRSRPGGQGTYNAQSALLERFGGTTAFSL